MPTNHVLEQLHADHRHFGRLLELLRRELERLRQAEPADLVLLLDAVEYFEVYPDRIHHPREDVVLAAAAARDPELAGLARELREEHAALARLTLSLRQRIEDALRDAAVEREPLTEDLRRFIERQAAHMDTEEARLFPRIADALGPDDWRTIEPALPEARDPMFADTEQRYRALRSRVLGPTPPAG
jgi:hemerythrin-like domain-containing protein